MHPLLKYRDTTGLSQQELGELVGLSKAQISRIEAGRSAPSPGSAERLAAIVGVPAWDIMRHVSVAS